jgi:general secretion pathway protein G
LNAPRAPGPSIANHRQSGAARQIDFSRRHSIVTKFASLNLSQWEKTMKRRCFSLIELLTVMGIIAILAGMVIGGAGIASRKAAEAKTIAKLEQMQIALDKYYQEQGYYPQQDPPDKFSAKFSSSGSFVSPNNGKPYLEGYTGGEYVDAWGQPFYYQCPGTMNPEKYDLWSTGQDLKMGVLEVNDDPFISTGNGDYITDIDDTVTPNIPDYSDAQTPNAQDSDDITNWKRH